MRLSSQTSTEPRESLMDEKINVRGDKKSKGDRQIVIPTGCCIMLKPPTVICHMDGGCLQDLVLGNRGNNEFKEDVKYNRPHVAERSTTRAGTPKRPRGLWKSNTNGFARLVTVPGQLPLL